MSRRRRSKRKPPRVVAGDLEWVSCNDLAVLADVSRWTAWRIARSLHKAHGPEKVRRVGGKWLAHRVVVKRYLDARAVSTKQRLLKLEHQLAELEDRLRERDLRVDELARLVASFRDAARAPYR